MFLRQKATSWSSILLRDEILHAGIRPVRTAVKTTAHHHTEGMDGDEAALAVVPSEGADLERAVSC